MGDRRSTPSAEMRRLNPASRKGAIHFGEVPLYGWCRTVSNTGIFQRLPNFNGSNAYRLYLGYDYIHPSRPVVQIPTPEINGVPRPRAKVRRVIECYTDGTYQEVSA